MCREPCKWPYSGEADAATEMDRSIIANVDGSMRTPSIPSTVEEQEIKRLIFINDDRVFSIVP
jgi:hypothetical protein